MGVYRMNIFEYWQEYYCAGYPIPLEFRQNFTKAMEEVLQNLQKPENFQYRSQLLDNIPCVIYRLISGEYDEKKNHYGLYYSFSKDINGIMHFAEHDRHFVSGITLILAKPIDAVHFTPLVGYGTRYDKENEIVSKISKESIIETKYFKTLTELKEYLSNNKGE